MPGKARVYYCEQRKYCCERNEYQCEQRKFCMTELVLGVGGDWNKCLRTERLLGLDLRMILSKMGRTKKGEDRKA